MSATTKTNDENDTTLTNGIDNLGTWCIFSTTRPLTASLANGLKLEVRPTTDKCQFDAGLEVVASDTGSGVRTTSGELSTTLSLAAPGEEKESIASQIASGYDAVREDARGAEDVRKRVVDALGHLDEATDPDGVMVSLDDRGVDIYEATESVTYDPETADVTVMFRHDGNTYPQTYTASQWDHSHHDAAREEKDPRYEAARVPPISAREKYTDPHVICRPEDAHRWQTLKRIWARMATAEDEVTSLP